MNEKNFPKLKNFKYINKKIKAWNKHFLAPEIIEKQKINEKVDIWSFGILIYYIIYNKYPFNGKNKILLYKSIIKNKIKFWLNIKPSLKDLIKKMLEIDVNKRIGIWQVLQH